MLGFARASVARISRVQSIRQLSAVASSVSSNGGGVVSDGKNDQPRKIRKSGGRLEANSSVGDARSTPKHQIETKNPKSLNDIVEIIEWRGQISGTTLDQETKMFSSDAKSLGLLTDRQLSVLLSAYGSLCDPVARKMRSTMLNQALTVLEKNNIVLGTQARGAVLSCRIDNGESVNVVEELQTWNAANVTLDSFAYSQLARAYAKEGNLEGVVDIVNHMKSEGLPVDGSFLESMVFAIAKKGQYAQAEFAIKKFAAQPGQSELRLRISAACAAASQSDLNVVVQQLSMIPSSEKIHMIENNKLVLSILYELLENGQHDAIEKMKQFLTMTEDGSSLVDWHNNGGVVATSRRLRAEGKLEAALRVYSLVHPNARNSHAEEQFRFATAGRVYSKDASIAEIFAIADLAKNVGIIPDPSLFLLVKAVDAYPERTREIYNTVKERGHLQAAIEGKLELKLSLARKLTEGLYKLDLEAQLPGVIEAAFVLFHSLKGHSHNEILNMYQHIFAISQRDVIIPIAVIPLCREQKVKTEFTTAVIQQLLNSQEALATDRLNKFLESGVARNISLSRIAGQVVRLLGEKKNAQEEEKNLILAAKLISLEFPETTNAFTEYACNNLIQIIVNPTISEEKTGRLVDLLEQEIRVGFSYDDFAAAKKILSEKNMDGKYTHIQRLKKKSQTYARWTESSISALEDELNIISGREKTNPGVVEALRERILMKIGKEDPIDLSLAERHIRQALVGTPKDYLRNRAYMVQAASFQQAVTSRQLDQATSLWDLRKKSPSSIDMALVFACLLHLKGDKEQAATVFEDIRKTGMTIKPRILDAVGSHLVDFPDSELTSIASLLQKKFNFTTKQTRRVVNKKKLETLNKLIDSGDLNAALQLAAEESNASGAAFGHHELAKAAIRKEDIKILHDVFNIIVNHHSRNAAYADFAYVFLEEGKYDKAQTMLNTSGLTVSTGKLEYFIQKAADSQRADVLRGLFTGLKEEGRASTVDLNKLLLQLTRIYYNANDLVSLASLREECKKVSFPLDYKIRSVLEDLDAKKSTTV